MIRRWFAFVLVVLAVVLHPHITRADQSAAHSVSVAVLALDSDDAEEQADALTAALRSRIRVSQGWALVETTQSLGMLTAALRCTTKPLNAECEQRIAEHIKSERFIYGYVTKGAQPNQVTAEIHLYQRSKPDTVIRESYADNLKDPNDDTLREIAQRVLERLGDSAVGTLVVRMGSDNGEVVIDGDKRVPLQNGVARLELSPGGHSVEVTTASHASQRRNVLVVAGKETVVDLALSNTSPIEPRPSDSSFPTRKVVGGGLAAVGIAAGVVAVVSGLGYLDAKKKGEDFQNAPGASNEQDPKLPEGKTADEACGTRAMPSNSTLCRHNANANSRSTIFWVSAPTTAVFLLAGVFLLATDGGSSSEKSARRTPPSRIKATPSIGFNSASLFLSGSF